MTHPIQAVRIEKDIKRYVGARIEEPGLARYVKVDPALRDTVISPIVESERHVGRRPLGTNLP